MARLSKEDKDLASNPGSFSGASEPQRVYGGGRQMLPSEMGFSPADQALLGSMSGVPPKPVAVKPPPGPPPPLSFQEWEKRQKELGFRSTKPTPKPKEEEWLDAGPGKKGSQSGTEMSAAWEKHQGDGPDEFAGLGPDGKPMYTRRKTGTIGEPPPQPVGIPPSGDGPIDTAMDIYRGSAKNYPKNAPIDEQKGFAVAASTWDYNNMGYSAEEPVAAAWVTYDGRKGEVREYKEGERFFVSFDDDVILRMKDRK